MNARAIFIVVVWIAIQATARADEPSTIKLLDGTPTRIRFTGNPHHPTFGMEKLTELLDRHFDGKSPIAVDGLADARKDPETGLPIPQAKLDELGKFLAPVLREQATRTERLVVLTYALVESPRTREPGDWVKERADALEKYGRDALAGGATRVFVCEMPLPDFSGEARPKNRFRREGVKAIDELAARRIAGIERGPRLQELTETDPRWYRDGRHFSQLGRDYLGYLWYETLLKHDGLPTPPWWTDETKALATAE